MMDSDIQDLVRNRRVELTIGPVVFKHFMLNNDGRLVHEISCPCTWSVADTWPRFYMLRKPTGQQWAVGSPHNSPRSTRRNK